MLVSLTVGGCLFGGTKATMQPSPTSDVLPKNVWTEGLPGQAEFDLQCPVEELTFKKTGGSTTVPNVGVTGCGKRAHYVYGTAGYVANTMTEAE